MDFLVKRYPNGKQSTHLHSLKPGDTLLFAIAIPGYRYTPNMHSHVTMIAGGAGITPMYQLIQGIFNNPEDKTKITLVFGINNDEDALLKDEFESLTQRFPNRFTATYTVSQPSPGSKFRKGYVSRELLQEVAPEPSDSTKVFVCGPPAMEASLLGGRGAPGILEQIGYKKGQVFKF